MALIHLQMNINESYYLNMNFTPLSISESLPFPLNTDDAFKILISLYLVLNLAIGSSLRLKILVFTKCHNFKENPINLFIWFDQLNGILQGINIIFTLFVLQLSFPLSDLIGKGGCNWMDLIGTLYLIGQTIWSSFIAIYRLLYIRFQRFFKNGLKQSKFALIASVFGNTFVILSACIQAYFDKGILYKICSHQSVTEVAILKVRNF